MTDLSEPIRKMKKLANKHRGVADLEKKYAEVCNDEVEYRKSVVSAFEHDQLADSYEAAMKILEEHHAPHQP